MKIFERISELEPRILLFNVKIRVGKYINGKGYHFISIIFYKFVAQNLKTR